MHSHKNEASVFFFMEKEKVSKSIYFNVINREKIKTLYFCHHMDYMTEIRYDTVKEILIFS